MRVAAEYGQEHKQRQFPGMSNSLHDAQFHYLLPRYKLRALGNFWESLGLTEYDFSASSSH